jgi:flagellar biosynthetic protein FlhB
MAEVEEGRSEQPTPFKLRRSREKGVVARGLDIGFLAVLAAFAGYAWAASGGVAGDIAHASRSALVTAPQLGEGSHELLALSASLLSGAFRPVMLLACFLFAMVLLAEIAQVGFLFSAQPLKADFSRLSPAAGLKRVFSVKMLIETLKNVLKLAAYAAAAWWVLRSPATLEAARAHDARELLAALAGSAFRLIFAFALVALIFAAVDQILVRRLFLKQMRMSRREVRRELRDREGEPRIKQRRRQLHAQFAKATESLRGVPGADVVVTNPTHVAVALKYDNATMEAPMVVAKGAHEFAARIRRTAFVHGVLTIEDRPLARALYAACAAGDPIPEAQYGRVAQIYRKLRAAAAPAAEGGAGA